MESDRTSQEKGTDFQLVASSDDDFGAGYKMCKICGEDKPLEEFYKHATCRDGHKSVCKSCICERKVKRPAKRGEIPLKTIRNAVSKVTNDRIQQALEAAAYRIIKESM